MAALDLLCPCRKMGQAVATWGTDGALPIAVRHPRPPSLRKSVRSDRE